MLRLPSAARPRAVYLCSKMTTRHFLHLRPEERRGLKAVKGECVEPRLASVVVSLCVFLRGIAGRVDLLNVVVFVAVLAECEPHFVAAEYRVGAANFHVYTIAAFDVYALP